MARQVMPEFQEKRNVIILFESWYMKKNLVAIVEEYQNPSCPHRHLWFKADNGLCNRSRKGYGLPPPVLQHSITGTAADFLRMAGKSPLNQTGSRRMKYIPLFLYSLWWNIEVSYYKQKTFWSLCDYMVRSRKGIEMLANLFNISYLSVKLLPYKDEMFSKYRTDSVQEFCFVFWEQIRRQVFYALSWRISKPV